MTNHWQRRQFLYLSGGFTLALATNSPIKAEILARKVEIKAFTADGQPLNKKALNQLYFLTLAAQPLPNPPRSLEEGKLFSFLPLSPVAITLKLLVRDFGEMFLVADNRGLGYSEADFPLNFNLAAADSHLYRVKQSIETWQSQGWQFSPTIRQRLQKAASYLDLAKTTDNHTEKVKYCDQSLNESLWAGEMAVISKSQQIIAQSSPKPDFLFGCNFFGYPEQGEEYEKLWQAIFNFATIPFYWRFFEQNVTDKRVNWLLNHQIIPKGHPLVWFHEVGIPDQIRNQPFDKIKELVSQRVREVTSYYRGKISYFDVINEANGIKWANELNFSLDQFVELTQIACQESRRGNPQVYRIINSCCTWGENVAYHQPPQHSPLEYLQTCLAAGIEFEAIGLQLYYPDRDLFEIDRQLERFSQLGKPIHITELGISSATTIDESAYLKEPTGRWRGDWSEAIQADWVEQFYTLCYSKSDIKAISWWDLTDKGNFWPHGGLVNQDMTPKLAYQRLKNLLETWRGQA